MEFAGYVVEGRIGAGSTGVVWRATQVGVDRPVAIKELAPALATNAEFRARFRDEARVLATLDHPNIVAVYDYVDDADAPFIVEELVDGASLQHVVARAGRLRAEQAASVLRGALAGLAAVHARGLVHGDVSPANILVDVEGTSKLVDFGLASPQDVVASAGALVYASPEVRRGDAVDARSDVFSSGRVLYELLSGETPPADDASAQIAGKTPNFDGGRRALAAVVARATAADPSDRYPDAAAFGDALEHAARDDLGAAWLASASIAALAAAAAGGMAAMNAAATGGSTVAATTSATGGAGRVAHWAARHRVPVAIGVATVTAAAVVAVVVPRGSHHHIAASPAIATDVVHLTATGAHPFQLIGSKSAECDAGMVELLASDYPTLGSQGSLSITPSGIKGEIDGRDFASDTAGIAFSKNAGGSTVVDLNTELQGNGGATYARLNGEVTCAARSTPSGASAGTATPTTAPTSPAAAFAGTYEVTRVITKGNSSLPAGTRSTYAVTLTCSGSPCALKSTTWAGLTLTGGVLRSAQTVPGEPCPAKAAGSYTLSSVIVLHVSQYTVVDGRPVPRQLVGTQVLDALDATCPGGAQAVTESVTAVRRS